MMTDSHQAPIKLTSSQAQNLRRVLLDCNYMKLPDKRQQVLSDLRKDYPSITFETYADPQIEVSGIIDRCIEFGGADCFECFLRCLASLEDAVSSAMRAVWAAWREVIAPPPVPQSLRGRPLLGEGYTVHLPAVTRTPRTDEFSRAGSEFHWDRDLWVQEFMDVVSATPGNEDLCVVAFPAPPEADPDRFAQYLEAKCIELARLTGGRIATVRLQLTGDLQSFQIVARILDRLADKAEHCRVALKEAAERTRKQWQWARPEARAQLSEGALADEFCAYLREAARSCRPVILLHSLEQASPDLRSWILYTWLESHQSRLAGSVVALAGNEGLGLESLNQAPYMVCRTPLPQMDAYDLWEWAYYGHELTWLTQEFVAMLNKVSVRGSARKFYDFIEFAKALAQWIPAENLPLLLSQRFAAPG